LGGKDLRKPPVSSAVASLTPESFAVKDKMIFG
jgi:hypothetical protein